MLPLRHTIKHYRGDSYDATIHFDNYQPTENDKIVFCIRETEDSEQVLVKKEIDPIALNVHLESSDTQRLPFKSVYDMQITYTDEAGIEYTKTFVRGNFYCTKDVAR